jgi:hypothetical protein
MDADELIVSADSKESAIMKAKKKWRLTIGAEWPDARLGKVFILTPARLAKSTLAYLKLPPPPPLGGARLPFIFASAWYSF